MKAALNAVAWEIFWKNRLVFPVLALLLCIGTALSWAITIADPGAGWVAQAKTVAVMAFLISILIGFAPFTLMESTGGWRMNSMITRWFALPMPTGPMVLLPLLIACAFLAALIGAWMVVLHRIEPSLDGTYFVTVFIVGQIAINALAYSVPRKPTQFWLGMGLLFPVLIILALAPQDQPHNEEFKRGMLIALSVCAAGLIPFAWYAATRNRCGAWTGEVPLDWLLQWARGGPSRRRTSDFGSPVAALMRT